MFRATIRTLLVNSMALLASTAAYAQPEQCESCVRLVLVAELSTSVAPIVPSRSQSVLRTPDGRLLVSHRFVEPQIVAYDSAGRFLQVYDAVGEGPGEFGSAPWLLPAPDNSVWALDRNRVVRLDSQMRPLETRNLGTQHFVPDLVLLDSIAVFTGRTSAPGDSVFSVSLMDTVWNVRRTLERPASRYGLALIGAALPRGFWTLGSNELLLRRYSDRGVLSDSVMIFSPYFEPWDGPLSGEGYEGFDIPPRPRHTMLSDAGRGRVVVLTRFADEKWAPTPSNQTFNPSERDENALYDTVLGVIDMTNGRTTSTRRVDEYLKPVAGARDMVFATRVDGDGHVVTRIYRLQLP